MAEKILLTQLSETANTATGETKKFLTEYYEWARKSDTVRTINDYWNSLDDAQKQARKDVYITGQQFLNNTDTGKAIAKFAGQGWDALKKTGNTLGDFFSENAYGLGGMGIIGALLMLVTESPLIALLGAVLGGGIMSYMSGENGFVKSMFPSAADPTPGAGTANTDGPVTSLQREQVVPVAIPSDFIYKPAVGGDIKLAQYGGPIRGENESAQMTLKGEYIKDAAGKKSFQLEEVVLHIDPQDASKTVTYKSNIKLEAKDDRSIDFSSPANQKALNTLKDDILTKNQEEMQKNLEPNHEPKYDETKYEQIKNLEILKHSAVPKAAAIDPGNEFRRVEREGPSPSANVPTKQSKPAAPTIPSSSTPAQQNNKPVVNKHNVSMIPAVLGATLDAVVPIPGIGMIGGMVVANGGNDVITHGVNEIINFNKQLPTQPAANNKQNTPG